MSVNIEVHDLKALIKEAVREVMREEEFRFFINTIPYVSDEEMEDIKKFYNKPEEKKAAFCEELEL